MNNKDQVSKRNNLVITHYCNALLLVTHIKANLSIFPLLILFYLVTNILLDGYYVTKKERKQAASLVT